MLRRHRVKRLDEVSETIGEVWETKGVRRIRRSTGARCVPGDDGELVRERVDLAAPGPAVEPESAVEQYQRRSVALALVGDSQSADLDVVHVLPPSYTLGLGPVCR
jgi:hypothetical protein